MVALAIHRRDSILKFFAHDLCAMPRFVGPRAVWCGAHRMRALWGGGRRWGERPGGPSTATSAPATTHWSDTDLDLARLRELDRIAEEVVEHLPNAERVQQHRARDLRVDVVVHRQAFGLQLRAEHGLAFEEQVSEARCLAANLRNDGVERQVEEGGVKRRCKATA